MDWNIDLISGLLGEDQMKQNRTDCSEILTWASPHFSSWPRYWRTREPVGDVTQGSPISTHSLWWALFKLDSQSGITEIINRYDPEAFHELPELSDWGEEEESCWAPVTQLLLLNIYREGSDSWGDGGSRDEWGGGEEMMKESEGGKEWAAAGVAGTDPSFQW